MGLGKCIGLLALVTGCGVQPTSPSESMSAPSRVLLAVMGGNASCKADANGETSPYGMKMYTAFETLADSLRGDNHLQVDFFLSCYNLDATVHYFTSDQPQTLLATSNDQVPGMIGAMAQNQGSTRVYLAGHSYGGWLAMKTGLALPAGVDVGGLVTIDPISQANCTILNPADCTEAPSDIVPADRQTLRQRVGTWDNFYETNTFFLHSSAIAEASANTQLDATHFSIEVQPAIWTAFDDVLKAAGL
jgi:pimeloyl-ACP methyl ester carboxylesterase